MRNLITVLSSVVILMGCKKNGSSSKQGELLDYGYVSNVSSVTIPTPAMMFYRLGDLFVATNDGVWKMKISDRVWQRAGLDGKKINLLYNHPYVAGKFIAAAESNNATEKSLYISSDAGLTWQPVSSPVFDIRNSRYETYSDIRVRPGFPNQVFANLGGATIAISKDGGQNWHRQNYRTESYFGIDCVINFLDGNPNEIFQGSEAPLDHAWLGKYSIDATDPVQLGTLNQFIGKNYEWENRRPNCLETFQSNPGVLYVGMEGALSKVEGTQWKYLFKSTESGSLPSAYIKGVWLNPANKKHIIFGGGVNGTNTTLSLFETYDEGATITHIKDKLGMADPEIIDIVSTDSYPALLIRDNGNNRRLRVVIYKF